MKTVGVHSDSETMELHRRWRDAAAAMAKGMGAPAQRMRKAWSLKSIYRKRTVASSLKRPASVQDILMSLSMKAGRSMRVLSKAGWRSVEPRVPLDVNLIAQLIRMHQQANAQPQVDQEETEDASQQA